MSNIIIFDSDFIISNYKKLDRLKEKSPIPLISIVEATCEEAKRRGLKKIGLLGTIFTMTGEFFKAPFVAGGIDFIVPNEEEMALINEKISTELELGIVKEDTLTAFQHIIARMKEETGIEAIILGCKFNFNYYIGKDKE